MRKHNFSAGPASIPESVLQTVQTDLLNWQEQGMSILEMPHRSDAAVALLRDTEQRVRQLLAVPDHFHILFLHGGGRGQFASIPMNLLGKNAVAGYAQTGRWSKAAAEEAKHYGDIHLVCDWQADDIPWAFPPVHTWQLPKTPAYLYYCDNETIPGMQFHQAPAVEDVTLVVDMTSSLFSKPIDWTRHGLAFAAMQKSLGPTGLSLVIVREDLLDQAQAITPSVWHYQTQAKHGSAYNTLPMFNLYLANLMLQWMDDQGGVSALQAINARKAKKLYDAIDAHPLYTNEVAPAYRSHMNATFCLPDAETEAAFLSAAEQAGLCHLKGHHSLGGIRVSLYNSISENTIDQLIEFMRLFKGV